MCLNSQTLLPHSTLENFVWMKQSTLEKFVWMEQSGFPRFKQNFSLFPPFSKKKATIK